MKKMIKESVVITLSFIAGAIFSFFVFTNIGKNTNTNTPNINKVQDATVTVEVYAGDNSIISTGSGFIYKIKSKKAYILTNNHVIDDGEIKITNSKGETVRGKVLGADEVLDIAVIEIDKKYAPQKAIIGSSEKTKVGDTIYTVGSPMNRNYSGTITKGILSGKNRDVPATTEDDDEEMIMHVLQFDAAVNPGSSGGPLINEKGEVIGICLMKLIEEEIEGMGFAIPIETAINHVKELEKGNEIEWPVLGIHMVNLSNKEIINNNDIKIPSNVENGIVVIDVQNNSSAYNKLKKGDILTKIDSLDINDTVDVQYVLTQHKKGDTIKITLIRNGKQTVEKIKLK